MVDQLTGASCPTIGIVPIVCRTFGAKLCHSGPGESTQVPTGKELANRIVLVNLTRLGHSWPQNTGDFSTGHPFGRISGHRVHRRRKSGVKFGNRTQMRTFSTMRPHTTPKTFRSVSKG